MISLLGSVAVFIGLFALLSGPTVLVAHRVGEPTIVRRFAVAALVAGLLCGLIGGVGDRLEAQCLDEGNTSCDDYGGRGMVNLIVVGFLGTSVIRAYLIWND